MDNFRGYVKPGFEGVADTFMGNFEAGEELGAGFCALLDGEIVVNITGGWMDRKKTSAWGENTLVPIYSTTKPIAALVVAHVIDGLDGVTFDTLVGEIWPEFACAGKENLTIAHVLSHQGGLVGFVDPIDPALWLDPPALSAELAKIAPLWQPVPDGTSGYHPLSWGYLAGEIVRRIAGKSLGTVLAETFTHTDDSNAFDGIDFWIGTPASEHERCAEIQRPRELPRLGEMNEYKRAAFGTKWSAPDRGGAIWREIEIPSANGHGTAESVARIYGAFAHNGMIGETQVAGDETWADFLKVRTSGPDRVLPFDIEFAAGVMHNKTGFYGPNPNSWGHSGWGGSAALGDPDAGLSCAYVMNRQSAYLQGDPRAQRLFAAVYDCLN